MMRGSKSLQRRSFLCASVGFGRVLLAVSVILAGIPVTDAVGMASGTSPKVQKSESSKDSAPVDLRKFDAAPGTSLQWWYLTGPLWTGSSCQGPAAFGPADQVPDWGVQLTFFYRGQGEGQGLLLHGAVSNISKKTHEFVSLAEPWKPGTLRGVFGGADSKGLNLRMGKHFLSEIYRSEESASPQEINGRWWLQYATKSHELQLEIDLPRVLIWAHGNNGFVQKTKETGNQYVSLPVLPVRGIVRNLAEGTRESVCGSLWFDHEVGVQNVEGISWQWFALRFADGRNYMFYQLKEKSAQGQPVMTTMGERFDVRTARKDLLSDVRIEEGKPTCLASGNCYPQEFSVHFKNPETGAGQVLKVESFFAEQEMKTEFGKVYWEGLVTVKEANGASGLGYVELTQ